MRLTFYQSMKNLGVNKTQADDLIGTMIQIRQSAAGFKNSMLQGKNIAKSTKEFNKLMNDRFQNSLATDYKILTDPNVFPFNGFKPKSSIISKSALVNFLMTR